MNLKFLKIDKYGFYLFGFRFVNRETHKDVVEQFERVRNEYKNYNYYHRKDIGPYAIYYSRNNKTPAAVELKNENEC